jgi:hypothetical protein
MLRDDPATIVDVHLFDETWIGLNIGESRNLKPHESPIDR